MHLYTRDVLLWFSCVVELYDLRFFGLSWLWMIRCVMIWFYQLNWVRLVSSRVLLTKLPRDLFICVCFSLFVSKRSFDHQRGKVEARGARPLDLPGSLCWFSLNVLATCGFDISNLGMFGWISWPVLAERRSEEFGQEMSFWGRRSSNGISLVCYTLTRVGDPTNSNAWIFFMCHHSPVLSITVINALHFVSCFHYIYWFITSSMQWNFQLAAQYHVSH